MQTHSRSWMVFLRRREHLHLGGRSRIFSTAAVLDPFGGCRERKETITIISYQSLITQKVYFLLLSLFSIQILIEMSS